MYQIYLISEILLLLFGSLFIMDEFDTEIRFLTECRILIHSNRRVRRIILFLDSITFILMLVFPVSPGPALTGDLLPAICILMLDICLVYSFSGGENRRVIPKRVKTLIGTFTMIICAVHFIVPSVILL